MSLCLFELLESQHNDLTDHDLAVLADWANEKKNVTPNKDWKRAYALIREGADLLLRRRARSSLAPGSVSHAEECAGGGVVKYCKRNLQGTIDCGCWCHGLPRV